MKMFMLYNQNQCAVPTAISLVVDTAHFGGSLHIKQPNYMLAELKFN